MERKRHALARADLPVGPARRGKTHLLRAARQALLAQGAAVGWLDADAPPRGAQRAVGRRCVDDAPYGAELQHTAFNWFVNAVASASGRPRAVLAAGELPPADLPLREDLRTRLGWGHVFELQVLPETEMRAVLRRAADARGVFLSDEVMNFVLGRFSRDLGSLMQFAGPPWTAMRWRRSARSRFRSSRCYIMSSCLRNMHRKLKPDLTMKTGPLRP